MAANPQSTLDFSKASRTFGPAYDPALDGQRLAKQHERIRDYMLASGWRTLSEISQALGYPESSISAQLRHLRKAQFGSYVVRKERRGGGWAYMVLEPESK